MNVFKYIIFTLLISLTLFKDNSLYAQSFFGYQSIGRNTIFFSLSWQGKPQLGFGYNYRAFGKSFTDWQAEIRFPVDGIYKFENYELITGFYKPLAIKRTFMGFGGHLRWQTLTAEALKSQLLRVAFTALPSFTYAASLNDGAYGTIGARISYAPVLFAKLQAQGKEVQTQSLAAHTLELGGHVDLHMERTLGLGLNVFSSQSFLPKNSILKKEENWTWAGDFYMGSTYRLGRN